MSRRGFTTAPCHGCGLGGNVPGEAAFHERPKDELCHDCQRIYHDGLVAREAQKSDNTLLHVGHTSTPHWVPCVRIHGQIASSHFLTNSANKEVEQAWAQFTWALTEPGLGRRPAGSPMLIIKKRGSATGTASYSGYSSENHRVVKRSVHEALNRYDAAIRWLVQVAYLVGYKDGADLLARLNEGLLSTSDFNEASTDKGKRFAEAAQYYADDIGVEAESLL